MDNDEVKDTHGRVIAIVNREALNTWLCFGTTSPSKTRGEQRPLAGAAKLRWAGQPSRGKKSDPPEKKE